MNAVSPQQDPNPELQQEDLIQAFDRLAQPHSSWKKLVPPNGLPQQQVDIAVKSLAKRIAVQAGDLVENRKNRAEVRAQIYQQMAPFLKELRTRECRMLDQSRHRYLSGILIACFGAALVILSLWFGS